MHRKQHGRGENRRYSEEEFRRIFEEATRSAEAQVPPPVSWGSDGGLTLNEIKEIAQEVQVDPAAVERAARNLPGPRSIRVPTEDAGPFARIMEGELIIGRALDHGETRMLVLEAERALARRGAIERNADGLDWRDEAGRVSLSVVRGDSATRVSIRVDTSPELIGGSAVLVGAGLIAVGVMAFSMAGPLLLAALPLAVGGTVGLVVLSAVGRRAMTRERLRQCLERLDEAVRTD